MLFRSLDAGYSILVGVLMVSTLLNIAYLFPIFVRAFFYKEPSAPATGIIEAPTPCLVAIGVTTAMRLLLFFFPDPVYRLAVMLVD